MKLTTTTTICCKTSVVQIVQPQVRKKTRSTYNMINTTSKRSLTDFDYRKLKKVKNHYY